MNIEEIIADLGEQIAEKEAEYEIAKLAKENVGKYSHTYYKRRDEMTFISGEIRGIKTVMLQLQTLTPH